MNVAKQLTRNYSLAKPVGIESEENSERGLFVVPPHEHRQANSVKNQNPGAV